MNANKENSDINYWLNHISVPSATSIPRSQSTLYFAHFDRILLLAVDQMKRVGT